MKSLLTLICKNFFSEMSAGSYDMPLRPLQFQFDFQFSRALKKHLKQMCRTKFCYYTNAKSQYPRVESDLRYSELHVPKMSPLSSVHVQLTKSQVQEMRDWRIKHGRKKNGEEHECKIQPKYSTDESLFNRVAYKSAI